MLFGFWGGYAGLRWESLTEDDRNVLTSSTTTESGSPIPSLQRMRNMMECSGISGTNFTDVATWDEDYWNAHGGAAHETTAAAASQTTSGGDASPRPLASLLPFPPDAPVVPKVPPIKCLHAHYAHYRSTAGAESTKHTNPVGELIHKQLELEFPELEL